MQIISGKDAGHALATAFMPGCWLCCLPMMRDLTTSTGDPTQTATKPAPRPAGCKGKGFERTNGVRLWNTMRHPSTSQTTGTMV